MATQNFFALLVDEENDDPSSLIAKAGAAISPAKELKKLAPPPPAAKLPSKPAPPAQAVRESQVDSAEGRGGRGGRGGSRGSYDNRDRFSGGAYNRIPKENEQNNGSFNTSKGVSAVYNSQFSGEAPAGVEESGRSNDSLARGRGHAHSRGRGRGFGYGGEGEEQPRHREFDRRSGTGRGNQLKRDGAGRGNWGVETDQKGLLGNVDVGGEVETPLSAELIEKKAEDVQTEVEDAERKAEAEEKDKEMTLEEYEKLLNEKRKILEALKVKERKVTVDKAFESMQLIEKKIEEEAFLKPGTDKGKKKESADKNDRPKKPVSINEFLKAANGEGYYSPTGKQGGRGRGIRGGFGVGGGFGGRDIVAPSIADTSQFPSLGVN